MINQNRARITVDLNGDWRQYNYYVPEYCEPLGIATCGDISGILVRQQDGLYCLIHTDGLVKLDQRKIKAALGISNNAGPPVRLNDAQRCNLVLDAQTREIFRQLGNGKMSDGARIAAKIAAETKKDLAQSN